MNFLLKCLFLSASFPYILFAQQQNNYSVFPGVNNDSIIKEKIDLAKIFASDTIKIHVQITACFGGEDYYLTITKKHKKYSYSSLYSGNFAMVNEGKLSPVQLDSIKMLFEQGFAIDNASYCTTQHRFSASALNIKTGFVDRRCNGSDNYFNKLKLIVSNK